MPKQEKLPGRSAKVAGPRPLSAGRRPNREGERLDPAPSPAGAASSAMRLVAEVERLATELAAARAKVAELEAKVDIDPLLGIFNRRGFERELKRALAYVQRYRVQAALVYVDLDAFKPINDAHGHAAGDAVLEAVAATLARQVRASDSVARLGGDEFVLLLWNLSEADAAAKTASLEQAVAAMRVEWSEGELSVGASAGFTALSPGDEAAAVLARADRAMYARKAERKRPR